MKTPPTFKTGAPSYLVMASTSGSVSPTFFTRSKPPRAFVAIVAAA
jgi:hypothetical protein